MDDNLIAISALQHYAYCQRQFALIHIEQVWEDNRYIMHSNMNADGNYTLTNLDGLVPEEIDGF
ncbi:MAG: CRISPR-associated protein Cas4 [Candidatus Thiodiazotropha sp. (ex Lucinoma kastoroae)]|nr:CRISPR-associated protein Cas4 [Candidatus Thiodiazotropha sp. (ex Lucinoma kastoroae)]